MKRIAFLFSGQGSQYVGMGKALCDKHAIAKKTFEEANDTLGFDLMKLCFEGSMEELTKTENTQPALLTASVAAFRVFMDAMGSEPEFLAGHSLGEFSALACAEAINFTDALKIVKQRGRFMQEAVPAGLGAMAAISGANSELIGEECRKVSVQDNIVVISNYNSPDQIVISGHVQAVNTVGDILKAKGARVVPLKVSAPFHSPLMQKAADRLKEELEKYTYQDLKYPVISNVSALPYEGRDLIIQNLSEQIVKPVQWIDSMEYLGRNGVEMAIELGPQTVLRNLFKKIVPAAAAFSYDKEEDVKLIKESLPPKEIAGNDEKAARLKLISRSLAIVVCTRNQNWDNDEYQKGVVEPYKKVQQMLEEIEKDGSMPTKEQMAEALDMLRTTFITKKTPISEQIERFEQVFKESGLRDEFPDFEMPV